MSESFEEWAAGVVYNNQPLTERGGIPYFLAEQAYRAGRKAGIEDAREVAAPDFTHGTDYRRENYVRQDIVEAIDEL